MYSKLRLVIGLTKRNSNWNRARTAVLLAGILSYRPVHGEQPQPTQSWPAEATFRFAGSSTLHDFGGQLSAQPFVLTISNHTWSAEADVLAGEMATASEGRDRKMHKMMNAIEHPRIHGKVVFAPIPTEGGTNVMLNLKIRDQQIDLPVRVTDWKETAEEIRFHAAWELSLKQYKLKPPSVLGVIRVSDRVRLDADVTANKTKPLTNAPTLHP